MASVQVEVSDGNALEDQAYYCTIVVDVSNEGHGSVAKGKKLYHRGSDPIILPNPTWLIKIKCVGCSSAEFNYAKLKGSKTIKYALKLLPEERAMAKPKKKKKKVQSRDVERIVACYKEFGLAVENVPWSLKMLSGTVLDSGVTDSAGNVITSVTMPVVLFIGDIEIQSIEDDEKVDIDIADVQPT